MGVIFAKKYNNFFSYYQSLMENKQKIEKQINVYFGDKQLDLDKSEEDSIKLDAIVIQDVDDSIKSDIERADKEAARLRRETYGILKP
jgi:intein-encoded DNA endonuclease-like protein